MTQVIHIDANTEVTLTLTVKELDMIVSGLMRLEEYNKDNAKFWSENSDNTKNDLQILARHTTKMFEASAVRSKVFAIMQHDGVK